MQCFSIRIQFKFIYLAKKINNQTRKFIYNCTLTRISKGKKKFKQIPKVRLESYDLHPLRIPHRLNGLTSKKKWNLHINSVTRTRKNRKKNSIQSRNSLERIKFVQKFKKNKTNQNNAIRTKLNDYDVTIESTRKNLNKRKCFPGILTIMIHCVDTWCEQKIKIQIQIHNGTTLRSCVCISFLVERFFSIHFIHSINKQKKSLSNWTTLFGSRACLLYAGTLASL